MHHLRVFAITAAVFGTSIATPCNSSTPYSSLPHCKVTPSDPAWPSPLEWKNLNSSLGGSLLRTIPTASSCYVDNLFGSSYSCDDVSNGWSYSRFHSNLPESINYPIWANNSCLPPNATGYQPSLGCHIGGYPSYIVNATTSRQVATALKWASDRNIRVVVKGTGHDLNGRSTGAFSLSIWTRHLNSLEIDSSWQIPGSKDTAHVLIAGSGNNWGDALLYTLSHGRMVASASDRSVGLGGFIQGGGHGPLSSIYGLGSDQILQVTVVTVAGDVLICNFAQNQDLFWAVRGGGGGQFGIVTEYVMLTYPTPATLTSASISLAAANMSDYSDTTVNATWAAFAQLMSSFPDLMDQGITGSGAAFTGIAARSILGLPEPIPGVLASFTFRALNMTTEKMSDLLRPLQNNILSSLSDASVTSFKISDPSTNTNYTDFFLALNASPSAAGRAGLVTSRLLGRAQVSDLAVDELASYLQRTMASRIETDGTTLSIALQGGPGLRNIPRERRGAVNPVWRDTYLHIIERTNIDTATNTPGVALREAGEWFEANKETIFREWAPDTGAYMNEANPFNSEWKHDFYGTTYERLVRIKRKFDPTYTLSVSAGVDSDFWEYNMDSGKLCQTS